MRNIGMVDCVCIFNKYYYIYAENYNFAKTISKKGATILTFGEV